MGAIVVDSMKKEYVERRESPRGRNGSAVDQGETHVVLDELSLEFRDGDFVCVLGPSGCGKSTLLRILAGFERQTSGNVLIDGQAIDGPSPDNIFVFQHSGLLPWMTVWENARLGVRRMTDKEAMEEKVREVIGLVELDGFEHHYPRQLSGGMQRRAELARALAVNPEILFMDEPFAGLDFLTRANLREEIVNMHELLRKTIVFITHDIDEAVVMADHLVVLGDRPARVKLSERIDVPHPRDLAKDERLAALRSELYRSLGVHFAL